MVIGDAFPRYTYSFRADAAYKGFDFNFFLQGVGKGNGYITGVGLHTFHADGSFPQEFHRDRWTPENTDASYPRFTFKDTRNSGRLSDYWLQNAAYLRLKNIQLGYTLPGEFNFQVSGYSNCGFMFRPKTCLPKPISTMLTIPKTLPTAVAYIRR